MNREEEYDALLLDQLGGSAKVEEFKAWLAERPDAAQRLARLNLSGMLFVIGIYYAAGPER